MEEKKPKNKDLILREKLALQRTTLANQSTFLLLKNVNVFLIGFEFEIC
jgi:putative membrane protein